MPIRRISGYTQSSGQGYEPIPVTSVGFCQIYIQERKFSLKGNFAVTIVKILKTKKTCAAILLIATLLLLVPSCGNSRKNSTNVDRGVCVAFADGEASPAFAKHLNPLYAANDTEFSIGMLVAPTVMRYDESAGWVKILGTITTEVSDGKTVATVTLDKNIKYSNGRNISISAYVSVLERITRTSYTGYYKDYYKNPIEGLVSFRYNCRGLTLSDIPDFDGELDEIFKNVSKEDYLNMLLETEVAGLYTDSQNPESIAPDGRSFKQIVLEESKNEEVKQDNFFIRNDIKTLMPKLLSEIYASKPTEQWMLKELRAIKYVELQDAFKAQCASMGSPCNSIPGVVSGGRNADFCTVTFSSSISEDEAIRILNLPVIYSYSQDISSLTVGAGAYVGCGESAGNDSSMFRFSSGDEYLSVVTVPRQNIFTTMFMEQIDIAVLPDTLTETEKESASKNNFQVKIIGSSQVIWNPDTVNEEMLNKIVMLF